MPPLNTFPALPCRPYILYAVWDVASCPYFSPYYFASAGADRTARLWSTDRVQPLRLFVGELALWGGVWQRRESRACGSGRKAGRVAAAGKPGVWQWQASQRCRGSPGGATAAGWRCAPCTMHPPLPTTTTTLCRPHL